MLKGLMEERAGSNPTDHETFAKVLQRRVGRRGFVKGAGSVPFSVKATGAGFPANSCAIPPAPVLCLPQWVAGVHRGPDNSRQGLPC